MSEEKNNTLKKELNAFDSFNIVIGSVIGSGIFISPGRVLALMQNSPIMALLAWFLAAIISLAGGLCYAELGCMFPKAGAEYQYLKNGIGRFWAYLFAWSQLMVLSTGSIAIMALASANYFIKVIFQGVSDDQSSLYSKLIASFIILFFTSLNLLGVKTGSLIQNILTSVKIAGILIFIILGFSCFQDLHFSQLLINSPNSLDSGSQINLFFKLGTALITCLWAYDGWNNLSRLTEESKNLEKNLIIGLLSGIGCATVIYLILNLLYFVILTPIEISQSKAIAISAINKLAQNHNWLKILGIPLLLGLLIAFSAAGATNGSILSGSRIYFGAARDNLFFGLFSRLNKNYTPYISLILQGFWAISLVWIGKSFETLLDYFSFSAWIFYAVCAGILIYLRERFPEHHRPYKVLFYPITPILFLGAALYLVISQIINAPQVSLFSLLALFGGAVFYPFLKKE